MAKIVRFDKVMEITVHIRNVNKKIDELGRKEEVLVDVLRDVQSSTDNIRNVSKETVIEYETQKQVVDDWEDKVEKIAQNYDTAVGKAKGFAAAGAGAGAAIATMGPTVAMGVATSFGVASTGTPIAALGGVAAQNAALAWLGGGALAAGGGGMAAGEALLVLSGPLGWGVVGVEVLAMLALSWKNSKDREILENISDNIRERDINKYKKAVIELNGRISRIDKMIEQLQNAKANINSFGLDYNKMTEDQQYKLGIYVNIMGLATGLLTEPIFSLQPNYTEIDFELFALRDKDADKVEWYYEYKSAITALANLLYKINLDKHQRKVLCKVLRKNKDELAAMQITEKEFKVSIIDAAMEALEYKYEMGKTE